MTEENQQADNNDIEGHSKISKFTIDLSQGLQRRIRLAADQNGLSISEYVEHILDEAIPEETGTTKRVGQPITREAIERLRRFREQLLQERNGRPFEDSVELIRQMRKERSRELEQL